MELLIDLGNSRVKWAYAQRGVLSGYQVRSHGGTIDQSILTDLWGNAPSPRRIACASVLDDSSNQALAQWCRQTWGREVLFAASGARGFGLVNAYAEPQKLGVDRWMAMAGARSLCAGGFCVIDAGTAVTVDLVDDQGLHRGGWIIPGARLLSQSLAAGTARVRAYPAESPPPWGRDTSACVHSGIDALFQGLTRVLIERLKVSGVGEGNLFVTGGDAARIIGFLPTTARAVPELVLYGLQTVPAE